VQFLSLKYTKIHCGWGSASDPSDAAYTVHSSPLARFWLEEKGDG